MAEPGIVITQENTICLLTFQRTARFLLAASAPIIVPVIACVVLAGIPNTANIANIRSPLVSAVNPWYGRSFVIFTPSVLITLYPPKKVPNPIAVAADKITHKGISSSGSIECTL